MDVVPFESLQVFKLAKGLISTQVLEGPVEPVSTSLEPVRCPVEVPLVFFRPKIGESPEMLCLPPVAGSGRLVLYCDSRRFD